MAEDDTLFCQQHDLIDPMDPISSMIVIRDSPIFAKHDHLVFPPINHENLPSSISEFDNRFLESPSESESPSSSSRGSASSFSSFPSDSDAQPPLTASENEEKFESPPLAGFKRGGESPPPPRRVLYREADDVIQRWWELLLVRVYSKFKNLMTWLSATVRTFYPVIGVAVWWWMRVRARRRRVNGEATGRLRDAIKERDERIVQLLHQVAQMNELLIKHHKEIVSRR
ncbi:unnamed protein product [Eruca vesicaria subsp. sativa]|uniref:Uncharacterized protein n=1 Tax=Eruca vesicaria subsp. sativa TaxID=29727 RepID=A0ABC8LW13_ERUVS|nr:unnamed protein product [Eruca vesicaria subsp. sativa]